MVRLLNTVLAVVNLVPGDRIRKEKQTKDAEVKEEVEEEAKDEEGEDGEDVVDDEDEEEVPFVEEIGWREVTGFIVMYVNSLHICIRS